MLEFNHESSDVIIRLNRLTNQGKVDDALDYLYDVIHYKITQGDFDLCEALLGDFQMVEDPQVGVALLVIVFPWKNNLQNFETYYTRLKNSVEKLWGNQETERIFAGFR